MSFTVQVKEEVIANRQMALEELAALIKLSGSLELNSEGLTLSITTENAKIARYIYEMLEKFYHVQPEIKYHQRTNLRKNRLYRVYLTKQVATILTSLKLADSFFGASTGIESEIFADDKKGRAYLRGGFLAAGTLTDPETGKYQLEIYSAYHDHADDLAQLLKKFMLDAKVIERKHGSVTYLQKAEDIIDLLIIIGAMQAKAHYEEVKLLKETRNDLNRATNVETANIAKTVTASMKTINNIIKIMETIGLESLPIELQEIAKLRVENPDYSIQELADHYPHKLSKSGVNHRLRKINKIAQEI